MFGLVRMKTVQLAIQDPEYAHSVRDLLSRDGTHHVHLVDTPDTALGGVIFADASQLSRLPLLAKEQKRLVVMVRKEHDDLEKIWEAGVRHVVFQGDPPTRARLAVLGVELSLGSNGT